MGRRVRLGQETDLHWNPAYRALTSLVFFQITGAKETSAPYARKGRSPLSLLAPRAPDALFMRRGTSRA